VLRRLLGPRCRPLPIPISLFSPTLHSPTAPSQAHDCSSTTDRCLQWGQLPFHPGHLHRPPPFPAEISRQTRSLELDGVSPSLFRSLPLELGAWNGARSGDRRRRQPWQRPRAVGGHPGGHRKSISLPKRGRHGN
jgi:hypothetical protein